LYSIGIVLKPQGVRGEVKVEPLSPYPERFEKLKKIFVQKETPQTYSVEKVRITDRFVFLKFVEINSRDEAENLRNCELLIKQEDLINLAADEYFLHDLIGCNVLSESGEEIGEITDIMQNSSNDVYIVNSRDGKEILIPAVKEVVIKVNIKQKKVIIRPMDGLLE